VQPVSRSPRPIRLSATSQDGWPECVGLYAHFCQLFFCCWSKLPSRKPLRECRFLLSLSKPTMSIGLCRWFSTACQGKIIHLTVLRRLRSTRTGRVTETFLSLKRNGSVGAFGQENPACGCNCSCCCELWPDHLFIRLVGACELYFSLAPQGRTSYRFGPIFCRE
jgi:hypothetical protein